mgnify:CR=1 FL=1
MSVIEITTSKKPDETFTVEVFYSDRTVSYDNVRGFDVSDDNTGAVLMFSDTHVDLTYLHGFRSLSVTSDTKMRQDIDQRLRT